MATGERISGIVMVVVAPSNPSEGDLKTRINHSYNGDFPESGYDVQFCKIPHRF
ncbi:MAG: hypothetical protein WCI87_01505 [Euryarchaeota archaeon]